MTAMKAMNVVLLACSAVICASVTAGCQVKPNPTTTTYTCPSSSGTAYVALNAASPATGLTYPDTRPAAGTYCYIAQAQIGTAVSVPSNIAGPYTTSGTNSVALNWQAPTTGDTPTGYVLSRVAAVATVVTVNAPTLGNATVAAVETHDSSAPVLMARLTP